MSSNFKRILHVPASIIGWGLLLIGIAFQLFSFFAGIALISAAWHWIAVVLFFVFGLPFYPFILLYFGLAEGAWGPLLDATAGFVLMIVGVLIKGAFSQDKT